MKKKKSNTSQQAQIRVGDISNVSGSVNIAAGDITTYTSNNDLSVKDVERLFGQIYKVVDSLANIAPLTKEDLKADLKQIQSAVSDAVQKKQKLDECFLAGRLRNIARMSPDILDVIASTLANPLAGFGIVLKKITDKAKEDIQST